MRQISHLTEIPLMTIGRTPTYQLRPEHSPSLAQSPLHNLSSLPIPLYTSPVPQHIHSQDVLQSSSGANSIPFIPGGGLTRRIISSVPSKWNVPTACLLQFVIEGDNRADAGMLASVTVKVLNKTVAQWKQPGSWREGLFGTPHDSTLYG